MSTSDRDLSYAAPVLRVADIERSLAYYRDQLGFDVEFVYEGFYASVIRDGCCIHFKCAARAERDQAAFLAQENIGACIGVRDAQAMAAQCATNGADFSVRLRAMPYGHEFYIRDPDGYILGFVQSAGA